jgi:hypothetical protein
MLIVFKHKKFKLNNTTEIATPALGESNPIPPDFAYILNYAFCHEDSNTITIPTGFVNIISYMHIYIYVYVTVAFHFVVLIKSTAGRVTGTSFVNQPI